MKNVMLLIALTLQIGVQAQQNDQLPQESPIPGEAPFPQPTAITTDSCSVAIDTGCCPGRKIASAGSHGLVFDLGQAGDALGLRAIDDLNGNQSILYRYVKDANTTYRIGFGIKGFNYNRSQVDSIGQSRVTTDSTFRQLDFYLAPGYEWHMAGTKRLDPYFGGQIEWGFLGKGKSELSILDQDTTGTVTQTVSIETNRGASLGFNAFAGFNYYVAKNLAIGAEYRLGYQRLFGGGDWTKVTIDKPLSGVNVVQREEGSDVVKSGVFSMNSFVGITLSYYFNCSKDCAAACSK